jgi:hypothetical protein
MPKKTEAPETDLAVRDQPITAVTLSRLLDTPTIPDRYETVGDLIATILVGREAGVPEMTAINNLYLVNGTVSMSAKLIAGLIFSAGHFMKMETSIKGAKVVAYRRDQYTEKLIEVATFSFGPADAKTAGLDEKDTYQNYPAQMYLNRAVSMAGRMVYQDVLAGIGYVPEEIGVVDVDATDVPAKAILVENPDADDSDVLDIDEVAELLDGEVEDG